MKSKMKRRMLAIVLCMVIVLSNSSFIFASSESGAPAVEAPGTGETTPQTETDTQVPETTPEAAEKSVSEPTPAPTEEPAAPTPEAPTPTPTQAPTVTPTPEATAAPTPAPEGTPVPTPAETLEETTTPAPTETPETTAIPTPTETPEGTPAPEPTAAAENGTSDTVPPTVTPTPTEAPVKSNEAVELKQEFKDSEGKVTSTVKAQIPEGTFAADASEITMEVRTPEAEAAEHVKEMMEENLPEHYMLGDYILYDIQFKVNGTVTTPNA